jgi:cytochrome b
MGGKYVSRHKKENYRLSVFQNKTLRMMMMMMMMMMMIIIIIIIITTTIISSEKDKVKEERKIHIEHHDNLYTNLHKTSSELSILYCCILMRI